MNHSFLVSINLLLSNCMLVYFYYYVKHYLKKIARGKCHQRDSPCGPFNENVARGTVPVATFGHKNTGEYLRHFKLFYFRKASNQAVMCMACGNSPFSIKLSISSPVIFSTFKNSIASKDCSDTFLQFRAR